jgi:hypothetical protein
MEGDLQASVREIKKAMRLMETAAPALVREEVISQQVSIFLVLDRLTDAQNALSAYGFTFDAGFSHPEVDSDAVFHASCFVIQQRSKNCPVPFQGKASSRIYRRILADRVINVHAMEAASNRSNTPVGCTTSCSAGTSAGLADVVMR